MTPEREYDLRLRLDRPALKRLAWAFGFSLALHLFLYGGYRVGKYFEIGQRLSNWMQSVKVISALVAPPPSASPPQPPPQEMPLIFVDVNPAVEAAEAPKNAKFYSNRNSEAANPESDADLDMPKLTGEQTDIVKAEDVRRAELDRLQPTFTPAEQDQELQLPQERTPQEIGDLAMAKPESNPRPGDGMAERPRPRTVKEALMRLNRNQLVGEKMKQEGGVSRRRVDPGFDVKATPFGNYDAMLIEAVQSHWYANLDNISFDGYQRGKVQIQFVLNYKGNVTELKVVGSTVSPTLTLMCEKAIRDPAAGVGFGEWPREMRLSAARDYRELNFTFYY